MKLTFNNSIKRRLTAAIGGLLTFAIVIQVAFFSNMELAMAASASSLIKQVEGKTEQVMSNAGESIDKVAAEIRGNSKEIRGKAKEGMGKAMAAGDDAKYAMRKNMNKAESKAKQAGAKAQEKGSNAVDAVKGFFGQ